MVYCLGILFLILGGFISVTNWYYAIKWMCKKWRNRRASYEDGLIPFFGGFLTFVGFYFFCKSTGRDYLALASLPLGFVADFWWGGGGIIYPVFLKFFDRKRKKKTKKRSKGESQS